MCLGAATLPLGAIEGCLQAGGVKGCRSGPAGAQSLLPAQASCT